MSTPASTTEHKASTGEHAPGTARVHKSLRIPADVAAQVKACARPGESESAAYVRLVVAGLAAQQANTSASTGEHKSEHKASTTEHTGGHDRDATVAALVDQLKVKDEQIATLQRIVERDQLMRAAQGHMLDGQVADDDHDQLVPQAPARTTWRARLAAWLMRDGRR